MPLFSILCWRHAFALSLRVVNSCSRTINPGYDGTMQSGGFTLGPAAHTNLIVKNGSSSFAIWAASARSIDCSVDLSINRIHLTTASEFTEWSAKQRLCDIL